MKIKQGSLLFTVPSSLKSVTATKKTVKTGGGGKQRPKMTKPKPVGSSFPSKNILSIGGTPNGLPSPGFASVGFHSTVLGGASSSASRLNQANSRSSL